jgi:phospholipid/cholesterol/gamma-HCH transport system permease protein
VLGEKMLQFVGKKIILFLTAFGSITILCGQVLSRILRGKIHLRNTLDEMVALGIRSFNVTVITAAFVGMAFAIQVVREFLDFGAGEMIGGVVALAVWRELAPLLTGVVFAGRVGAAISAEIGTMKVTEQIEALEVMSQDPVDYLVVPKIVACTLIMPLLVGLADIVGFLGGFLVAFASGRVNPVAYFSSAQTMLTLGDISGGLVKAVFFGFVISLISSYMGLQAKSGAKGVGEVTTFAVVISLISIFILNYFLSLVIF